MLHLNKNTVPSTEVHSHSKWLLRLMLCACACVYASVCPPSCTCIYGIFILKSPAPEHLPLPPMPNHGLHGYNPGLGALTTDNLALEEEASSIKREFPRGRLALASIHKKVESESIGSSHKASWALVMVVYTTLYFGGPSPMSLWKRKGKCQQSHFTDGQIEI